MKSTYFINFILILFCFSACTKSELRQYKKALRNTFLGEYEVASVHISYPQSDFIFDEELGEWLEITVTDTSFISSSELFIYKGEKDLLQINGLLRDFSNTSTWSAGFVDVDDERLIFERNNNGRGYISTRIAGEIWLENDSIFLDYIWDWTDSYVPYGRGGHISARGVRKK